MTYSRAGVLWQGGSYGSGGRKDTFIKIPFGVDSVCPCGVQGAQAYALPMNHIHSDWGSLPFRSWVGGGGGSDTRVSFIEEGVLGLQKEE